MLSKLDVVRVEDERIACNAGFGLVCFGDAAVNDKQAAACLDRIFSVLDRHVTVDNVCVFGV